MSLVSERDGFFGWRQVGDPYSLEERGWVEDVGSTGSYYPLPRWLVYMCMGGWNEPIRGWTGGLYEKHCYCRSAHHRDGWDGVVLDSEPLYYDEFADGGRYRFRSVDPMISRFGLRGVAVRAPFPLTVDLNLFQYAACSVGELAWTPYADLRNGSCSKRMLDLMNTFPTSRDSSSTRGTCTRGSTECCKRAANRMSPCTAPWSRTRSWSCSAPTASTTSSCSGKSRHPAWTTSSGRTSATRGFRWRTIRVPHTTACGCIPADCRTVAKRAEWASAPWDANMIFFSYGRVITSRGTA